MPSQWRLNKRFIVLVEEFDGFFIRGQGTPKISRNLRLTSCFVVMIMPLLQPQVRVANDNDQQPDNLIVIPLTLLYSYVLSRIEYRHTYLGQIWSFVQLNSEYAMLLSLSLSLSLS